MRVILNGDVVEFDAEITVDALLEDQKLPTRGVAVAINSSVVPKSRWQKTILIDGDCIDVIQAVQGG